MSVQEEFHDGALVVIGSCYGGRSWRVHPDGALTGITYGQVWQVARNSAHCPFVGHSVGERLDQPDDWRTGGYAHTWNVSSVTSRTTPHTPGALGCTCGYWSYHDLSLSSSWSHNIATVTGVIQAYGLMTRGSKGYRSQHADIVALVEPGWAHSSDPLGYGDLTGSTVWERVAARYPVSTFATVSGAMAAIHGRAAA